MTGRTATWPFSGPTPRSRSVIQFTVVRVIVDTLQVKKESAMTEKAWQGAGQKVGVQIWRIVKFKASYFLLKALLLINYLLQVEHWPKEEYGNTSDKK